VQGVLVVYNFEEGRLSRDEDLVKLIGSMTGGILGSVEGLQQTYTNFDILQAHFNLIQDGVIVLSVQ
jgi:hypothetical protein